MKNLVTFFMAIACILASCSTNVVVDNPTLSVSPSKVRNGDKVTITLHPGEGTNVELNVVFYWEGEEIGRANHAPHQVEYVVSEDTPGIYAISADASYSETSGMVSSEGGVTRFAFIEVIE